jgi:uncharacterized protein with FMN-binding domain
MTDRTNNARCSHAVVVLLAGVLLCSCASAGIAIKTPDFSALADGTYRGSFAAFPVSATVDVAMSGGRVEQVEIVSHRCGKGRPAEAIVNDVVASQSLEVDVVSGATLSSRVILKAIETALSP